MQLTFISAFESSPVHCLKPRPWGNRQRPGNGGTAAILDIHNIRIVSRLVGEHYPLPSIDVGHDCRSASLTVLEHKIFANPRHEVVFECSLDQLM